MRNVIKFIFNTTHKTAKAFGTTVLFILVSRFIYILKEWKAHPGELFSVSWLGTGEDWAFTAALWVIPICFVFLYISESNNKALRKEVTSRNSSTNSTEKDSPSELQTTRTTAAKDSIELGLGALNGIARIMNDKEIGEGRKGQLYKSFIGTRVKTQMTYSNIVDHGDGYSVLGDTSNNLTIAMRVSKQNGHEYLDLLKGATVEVDGIFNGVSFTDIIQIETRTEKVNG
jgi:hypothetical protein